MRMAFVGGGVMAEAMIGSILDAGLAAAGDVSVGEPLAARREHLKQRYGIRGFERNGQAIVGADLVVLSIKPQSLSNVLTDLAGRLTPDQSVVSIMAGIRMEALVSGLGHEAVIRVMPNMPAQVREGMTVWHAAPQVPEGHVEKTRAMLRTMGREIHVSREEEMDMATALSASGPAYVFLFIESLVDAGVYLGFSRDTARVLAVRTVLGSARLAEESGRHLAELRNAVTSPGGTTAEALLALEEGGFRAAVLNAVIAAYEKSAALGKRK